MEQVLGSSTDFRKYLLACENGDTEWVDKALSSGIVEVCEPFGSIVHHFKEMAFGVLVAILKRILILPFSYYYNYVSWCFNRL